MEQALIMESLTGKRGRLLKNIVTNAGEVAQLTYIEAESASISPKN